MGYKVVVFSRGSDKKELAMKLGATYYFDTSKDDYVGESQVQKFSLSAADLAGK